MSNRWWKVCRLVPGLWAAASLVAACSGTPVLDDGAAPRGVLVQECESDLGEETCSVCLLPTPDPPLDEGLSPDDIDWCGGEASGGEVGEGSAGTGGGAGGDAGGDAGETTCDVGPWEDLPWDETGWLDECADAPEEECGGGGGAGGDPDPSAGTGEPGDPGMGMGGAGQGAGAPWNPWLGGGGQGAAPPNDAGAAGGPSGEGAADPGAAGGEPGLTPQAGGGQVCAVKTWQDYYAEWCDLRKPATQAWCRGDANSGPPANIAAGLGSDYSYSCCQFTWSGNTFTRLPGMRASNGNCTDIGKARCETVPRPAWATHMTDTQWASLGVVGAYTAACMTQMRGWKSTKGWSDYGASMAVQVGCQLFGRTGCKGLDKMIASISAAEPKTNFQKRNLELLLAMNIALCTGQN